MFSSTFGPSTRRRCARRGIVVLGTATTAEEARALEAAGVDAVVAQGAEAGGHRGTFLGSFDEALVPLAELLPAVVAAVSVPVLAAGGIVDGRGHRGSAGGSARGASSSAPRSSSRRSARRRARGSMRCGRYDTIVTPAYTGRPMRAARTPFLDGAAAAGEPLPFPLQRAASPTSRSRRLRLLPRRHRRAAGARASGRRARAHARRRDGSRAALSLDAAGVRTPGCALGGHVSLLNSVRHFSPEKCLTPKSSVRHLKAQKCPTPEGPQVSDT